MKIRTLLTVAASLALMSGVARAAHVWEDPGSWWGGVWATEVEGPKFTSQELSLDLFGSYTAGERRIEDLFETNIRHGKWGGGAGLNYFLTREVGVGVDFNASDNRGNFVDMVQGSLILRLPWEAAGLAPYIFGGGGRGTDGRDPGWEWMGHGGVGLEWRFNPTTGIFVDGRYIWPEDSSDRLLLRAGLRLVF